MSRRVNYFVTCRISNSYGVFYGGGKTHRLAYQHADYQSKKRESEIKARQEAENKRIENYRKRYGVKNESESTDI